MDHHGLIGVNGKRLPVGLGWKPPENTPYFGFNTPHGPLAIALNTIAAVVPQTNPEANGMYVILLNFAGAPQVPCPPEDAFRLLRKMGWKQPGLERAEG